MKKTISLLAYLLFICLLTIITQIGGVAYLVYLSLKHFSIRKKWITKPARWKSLILFFIVYCFISFVIVPPVANQFGRTPLPVFSNKNLPVKPANLLTVVSNRHYVRPEMKEMLASVSQKMNDDYPAFQLLYLDANFPFMDGFPLLPHLSHDDGKKLDLAFLYKHRSDEPAFGKSPSWLGYGVCEQPKPGEFDQPGACSEKGHWQYSALEQITPKIGSSKLEFDNHLNAKLIKIITQHPKVKKVFIEPHLKTRLGLTNNRKVRFHGCHAVRHDDHIHLEL
ncbi:MAG: hypothetical protein AAF502_15325 [Bacteroidota bacterium]